MFAKKIEDLVIYVIALKLANEIHSLVNKVPNGWSIKEVDQVKRSSSSAPSNIAEGFGQRFYVKQFLHYLNIAKGSSDETKNHLYLLFNNHYIDEEAMRDFTKKYENLSVKILNFINYLKDKHGILLH